MKIIQNVKRETRNVIIIIMVALIIIGLFMTYFENDQVLSIVYSALSVGFGILLGMFLATPKYKVAKVEQDNNRQNKKSQEKIPMAFMIPVPVLFPDVTVH